MRNLALALVLIAISPTSALACSGDLDCEIGSRCVKGGGLYGVCMGGMNPWL
jgi:hypothetical protein